MKSFVSILAVFCVFGSIKADDLVDLRPALDRISLLIDSEALENLFESVNFAECNGTGGVLDYLNTTEYETFHLAVWNDVEYLDVMRFISTGGIPEIYDVFNELYITFGLPFQVGPDGPIAPRFSKRTLRDLEDGDCDVEEISEIINQAIPLDQIMALILELLSTDPSVQTFLAKLSEPAKGVSYRQIKAMDETQQLLQLLRDASFDIDPVLAFLEAVLGWNREP